MEVKPLKTSNTLFKSFLKIFIFPNKFLQGVTSENCNFVVEVHLNILKLFASRFFNYPMHCALFQTFDFVYFSNIAFSLCPKIYLVIKLKNLFF